MTDMCILETCIDRLQHFIRVHNNNYGINTRLQIHNTSCYKQSTNGEAPIHDAQDGSCAFDKDCVQSLLKAEGMFYQPNGIKHVQKFTGLENSLAAYTNLDNMDENNKFVCTECNKSN